MRADPFTVMPLPSSKSTMRRGGHNPRALSLLESASKPSSLLSEQQWGVRSFVMLAALCACVLLAIHLLATSAPQSVPAETGGGALSEVPRASSRVALSLSLSLSLL